LSAGRKTVALSTYDKKPTFLVKELDRILNEKGRKENVEKVSQSLPQVKVERGRVKVTPPANSDGE
jgi:hypothetical protein